MKIAVIGSGGREHAVAWKMSQSHYAEKVFTIPGNAATPDNVAIDSNDFAALKEFCLNQDINLVFVGPEQPLTGGIVDYFADTEIMVFGPSQEAAQLESSKIFAKKFMEKYSVATACYQAFDYPEDAGEYIKTFPGGCVIKFDGLAAGKGVYVCHSVSEAQKALQELIDRFGSNASLLVEELLTGQELSILAFTDGENYQLLQPSQDHKQLLAGDKGPNTGGMGAFCPVDFCTPQVLQKIRDSIIEPSINGLRQEKFNYCGVLYFGLMLTDSGPKVLEYNVRLGDPETEVVLPTLKTDLLRLVLSCYDGSLSLLEPEFNAGYYVDVVLASGGYPDKYTKGYEIKGLSDSTQLIFHAGTRLEGDKIVTSGGRVLNVVGAGISLQDAIEAAYEKVKTISFKDMYYRPDIGSRSVEQK